MESFVLKASQLILALLILVFIHEFGHYFFSRIFGAKVDKFYLFFNPKFHLFSVADKWFVKLFPNFTPTHKVRVIVYEKELNDCNVSIDKVSQTLGCAYKKDNDKYILEPQNEYKTIVLERISFPNNKKLRDFAIIEIIDSKKITWKDTEYGIGWVPLGGYCAISGMVDETTSADKLSQEVKPWEFRSLSTIKRLFIMIGGVLFNFILALAIYIGIIYTYGESHVKFQDATEGMVFSTSAHKIGFVDGDIPLAINGEPIDNFSYQTVFSDLIEADNISVLRNKKDTVTISIPKNFIFELEKDHENGETFMNFRMPVVISQTETRMGAEKAGLRQGDKIVAVNDVNTPSFDLFKAELEKNQGKTISVTYLRNGKEQVTNVGVDDAGKIGIMLAPITEIYKVTKIEHTLLGSIPRGITLGFDQLGAYFSSLKYLFTANGAKSIGGFGAIGQMFPNQWDWYKFWSTTAFLSIILAIMNILPIPALDGGHVLFLLFELITGRKPSEKFLSKAQNIGMALLLALLIYANGNDIYRLFFK